MSDQANKVVLVGDYGVGKTTIFTRFKTGKAEGVSLNTRRECEFTKTLTVDGKDTTVSCQECTIKRPEGHLTTANVLDS